MENKRGRRRQEKGTSCKQPTAGSTRYRLRSQKHRLDSSAARDPWDSLSLLSQEYFEHIDSPVPVTKTSVSSAKKKKKRSKGFNLSYCKSPLFLMAKNKSPNKNHVRTPTKNNKGLKKDKLKARLPIKVNNKLSPVTQSQAHVVEYDEIVPPTQDSLTISSLKYHKNQTHSINYLENYTPAVRIINDSVAKQSSSNDHSDEEVDLKTSREPLCQKDSNKSKECIADDNSLSESSYNSDNIVIDKTDVRKIKQLTEDLNEVKTSNKMDLFKRSPGKVVDGLRGETVMSLTCLEYTSEGSQNGVRRHSDSSKSSRNILFKTSNSENNCVVSNRKSPKRLLGTLISESPRGVTIESPRKRCKSLNDPEANQKVESTKSNGISPLDVDCNKEDALDMLVNQNGCPDKIGDCENTDKITSEDVILQGTRDYKEANVNREDSLSNFSQSHSNSHSIQLYGQLSECFSSLSDGSLKCQFAPRENLPKQTEADLEPGLILNVESNCNNRCDQKRSLSPRSRVSFTSEKLAEKDNRVCDKDSNDEICDQPEKSNNDCDLIIETSVSNIEQISNRVHEVTDGEGSAVKCRRNTW